jgi:hypothetical protein
MSKSIRDYTKSNRAEKTGTMVGVRMQDGLLKKVDSWRSKETDIPTRPEAIRRLVEKALMSG